MADQLRFDAFGPHTPHMNELAGESVRFNRAYCASALCVPARGAFFTGLYPCANGCLVNQHCPEAFVRTECDNLYELFEDEWHSVHSGKQHLRILPYSPEHRPDGKTQFVSTTATYHKFLAENSLRNPGGPSFRGLCPETAQNGFPMTKTYSIPTTGVYEEGFSAYFDGYFAEKAVDAIRNRDRTKPLLLNTMFLAPHPPFDIPEPYYSRVRYEDFALPGNVGVWYKGQSPYTMRFLPGFWGSKYSREQWREIWRVYLGLVSLLDDCVGMITDELKAQGIYDDTLIVFTSDHGEMLGSHRLWQKMCLYEESARTPLWFKMPRSFAAEPGERHCLADAVDVLPTLCDLFDRHPRQKMNGTSLVPQILDPTAPVPHDAVFSQYDGNVSLANAQRAVVSECDGVLNKLIVSREPDGYFAELYDLTNDPLETNNLLVSGTHADKETAKALLSRLRRQMRETGDIYEVPDDLILRFSEGFAGSAPSLPSKEDI